MPPGEIRTRNLSRRAAAEPRLRPLGHWDRRTFCLQLLYNRNIISEILNFRAVFMGKQYYKRGSISRFFAFISLSSYSMLVILLHFN